MIPRSKIGEGRVLPIRSARLGTVLEMARQDPKGEDLPPTASVFGNEIGIKVKSIRRPWLTACQKAGLDGLHFHG